MSDFVERALIAGSKAAQADSYVQKSDAEILALLSAPEGQRALAAMRAAISAALDPEDEALVSLIAQRLADEATAARNELRMIRQGIDLSNAPPVSPSIFKKDARAAISAIKAAAMGEEKP